MDKANIMSSVLKKPTWVPSDSLFTYTFTTFKEKDKVRICFQQKQTLFSLEITVQRQIQYLYITQFTITEESCLQELSQPLYDAAVLDLVSETLDFIYFYSVQLNLSKTVFLLNPAQAAHLTPLDSFFDYSPALNIEDNKTVLLSLTTKRHRYQVFKDQMADMKRTIQQDLWRQQRYDRVIRGYFQEEKTIKNLKRLPVQPQASALILSFPTSIAQAHIG